MNQGALHFEAILGTRNFEDGLNKIKSEIRSASGVAQKEAAVMDNTFKNLGIAIGGYFSAQTIAGFAKTLIDVRGEFQKTEVAFSTMLGNGKAAKALMGDMVALAARTPFSLEDVSKGAKQLLAFQVPANQIVDTLTRMGNIAAGLGVPIERINLIYGQVKAKGRLMGDDLRQFTEAGIPMIHELAKSMGVADSKIQEMVSDGKVGFSEVQKVLFNLTNEGGMFFNLMEEQSKTLSGQYSNMMDAVDQAINRMGESSQGVLSDMMKNATYLIEHYEGVVQILGGVIAVVGTYKASVMALAAAQEWSNKTIASEIAALSISDKMKLGRALVTQRQAAATLEEATAEKANTITKYQALQAEVSLLSVKRANAVQSAIQANLLLQEARLTLATQAQKLASLGAEASAREISIATKRVESAQNRVLALEESAALSRKAALAASSKFYTAQKALENTATEVGIASKSAENAQESLSIATKNVSAIATARLTIAQRLQVFWTNLTTAAQRALNASILANPYAVAAALIIGLALAIGKMAMQASYAEEIQDGLNKKMTESKQDAAEQEVKIKAVIDAIKSENTTNEQKKALMAQLNNMTQGKLKHLSIEAIRTGQLDSQVKAYIETLYKQAEAEAYLEDMKDLARKKAANNDKLRNLKENGPGWMESLGSLFDANSYTDGNWKNTLDSSKSFADNISVNILKENKEIDKAIEERKKLLAKNPAPLIKDVPNPQSQSPDSTNPTKEKKGKSGSEAQIAEIYPEGSIKGLQRRIQLYNDALETAINNEVKLRKTDKFGKDKDKKGNPLLTGETVGVQEAVKRRQELQTKLDILQEQLRQKSFDEEIQDLERKWSIRNSIAEKYGEDFANKVFPDFSKGSYFDDITKKVEEFKSRMDKGETLSSKDLENWQKLDNILKNLQGYTSPLEKFKKDLKDSKDNFKTTVEYLDYLAKLEKELQNDTSNTGLEKKKVIKTEKDNTLEEQKANYQEFLKAHLSFEEQKAIITAKYALLRKQIENDKALTPEKKTNALNAVNAAEGQELTTAFLDGMKKNPMWAKAFEDMANVATSQLKNLRKILSDQLNQMVFEGKPSTEIKALSDQIKEIDDTINGRNPFRALIDAIKDLGNEADTSKTKLEKLKNVAKGISASADLINQGISAGLDIAESLGAIFSDETKDIIQGVQTSIGGISDLASGIASMNPGQIIKGLTGVVKGLAQVFNGDRKHEKNIKNWQKAVDALKTSYEDLQQAVKNALGEDVYKDQQKIIANLRQQQNALQNMINEEKSKKKTDNGRIQEWQNQINSINHQIEDIYNNISESIAQTNVKSLSDQLADALIEAYGKGTDAASAYGKVADDVMKNAVKNALKMQLLEGPMQAVIDQLIKNMGFDENGMGSFDGLTEEERAQTEAMMQQASQNYMDALSSYEDLFGAIADTASSPQGQVKSVTEETASFLVGQLNGIRINQAIGIDIVKESLNVFKASYVQLVQIEANTKKVYLIMAEMANKLNLDKLKALGII